MLRSCGAPAATTASMMPGTSSMFVPETVVITTLRMPARLMQAIFSSVQSL